MDIDLLVKVDIFFLKKGDKGCVTFYCFSLCPVYWHQW